MRILDEASDKSINNILLCLTFSEALELRDSLNALIEKPLNNHAHIPNDDFSKEITVCVYDINNLKDFNKRSIDLILYDE